VVLVVVLLLLLVAVLLAAAVGVAAVAVAWSDDKKVKVTFGAVASSLWQRRALLQSYLRCDLCK
jgi:hypothetical protein